MAKPPAFLPTILDLDLLCLVEQASHVIGALDSAVTLGFWHGGWQDRAVWMGYARALQLQGFEIDEIDVISWGCGVPIPGRARFDTLHDPFEHLAAWRTRLADRERRHWREDLPFSPALPEDFRDAPILLRAIAIIGQYAAVSGAIDCWLCLPIVLHRMGLTKRPLPCLTGGDKGFRLRPRDGDAAIRRTLRDLAGRAADAVATAQSFENDRRRWIAVLEKERKPGALRALAALTLTQPVFRPEETARRLGLTLSGAGKLLDRAADHGFIQEVSGRRSWRVYMLPDMARRLGFAPALKGRPAKPPPLPTRDPLGATLAAFDAEMAELAARFPVAALRTELDENP